MIMSILALLGKIDIYLELYLHRSLFVPVSRQKLCDKKSVLFDVTNGIVVHRVPGMKYGRR